ncbi:MAG: sulfite exporter TauE/SafE family protein [Eubacteriales bacterium]|nr:sulfite exporter TauE/SafE family protein [Eubacteriales bacterium]
MTIAVCLIVCVLSTMLGAISGIGGGVLIKPMLDLTIPDLGMPVISLLSSCAVLSMSLFSVGKNYLQKNPQVLKLNVGIPLAIGSTVGGVLGKLLFNEISKALAADVLVKSVQNGLLFLLMSIVLINALRKNDEKALRERPAGMGLTVGLVLGLLSAFLGIGGGPLNMLALTGIYCMLHKEAALYSLFIIIFSQTAGIATALISGGSLPAFPLLMTACLSGILGGMIGRSLSKRMSNQAVKTLYNVAIAFILALCAFNIISALGLA